MNIIRSYYRLSAAGLVLGFGGILIALVSFLPVTIKKYQLSMWGLNWVVRALLFIFNVRITSVDREGLRQYRGFIFPNHVSYLDVLVLVAVTPMRFLAKEEVRSMPVVGLIANAIGCVFVKRDDKESRAEARNALAGVDTFPPIVLFPEGKRGAGETLLPFRYGAFEIVIKGNISFLPCIITYKRLDVTIWRRGESILKALMRLSSRSGPVTAQIRLLDPVQPTAADDPVQLSLDIHAAMTAVFQNQ